MGATAERRQKNAKSEGSVRGCGTVWKLTGGRLNLLHSFRFFTHSKDGMTPVSPLVVDATTGTLFGTTSAGGTGTNCGGTGGSCGTVFEIDSSGNYQVLREFRMVGREGALRRGGYPSVSSAADRN